MFATAGYFKGIICPFFEHGLCHRPHCHYRHSKSTAVGVFRSSLSTNITGSSSLKCQKDELPYKESGCHDDKGIQPTSNKQDEKISDLFSDATPTKDTSETTIKDIFGSSSDDDSDNNIHSPTVAMTTPDTDTHEDNSAIEVEFHKATTSSYMPKIVEEDEVGGVNNEGGTSGIKVGGVERGRSSIGTPYENKGIKRKRIAHSNIEVPRGPLEGSLRSKPKSLSDQKLLETLTDPNAIYSGKKRTARSFTNTTSPTTTTNVPSPSALKRPVLPLVMNAKVPTKIRQRFLDSFIDEYIRKGTEPQTAYDQSLEDERELYTRSTSRMIYMNISSHKLKKLQKEVDALLIERRRISDVKAGARLEGKETPKKKELPSETGVSNMVGIKHAETSVVKNSKKDKLFSKTISVGGDKDSITSLDRVSICNDRDKMELGTTHIESVPSCPSLSDDLISLANPSMSLFTPSSSHESPSIAVSQFYTNRKEMVSGGGDQDGCGQSKDKAKSKKKRVKNTSSFEDMLATADSTKIKKRKIKPALNLTINSRNIPSVCGDSSSKDSTCQTSSDIVNLTTDDLSHTHLSNTASSNVVKDETTPTFMEETTLSIVSVESSTPNLGVANTEFDNVGASEGIDSWQVFDKDLATPTFPPPPDSSSLINLTDLAQKVRAKRERNQKPPVKRKKIRNQKITTPTIHTTKPSFSIIKKKEPEFNAIIFYDQLLSYLLSEEQLTTNGYPRPSDHVGVALINVERQLEPLPEPLPGNAVRHYCCRCRKPFIIYNNGSYQTVEECVYHYGKLYKSREYGEGVVSQYSCCGERRDSSGCQVAMMHVTAGEQPSLQGGYTKSAPPPSNESYVPDIFAVDCEMCYTTFGLELTRVTLINLNLETVYESIVRPSHPIVDYNTRFSGLTAEDFTSVTTSISDVHSTLLSLVYEDTILIGHSLDSDLRAMKYIHSAVVDTAIVFPHRKGPPFKRALKTLMSDYLQKIIQDSVDGGHDSREDATACMELMIWKIKSDLKKTKRRQL